MANGETGTSPALEFKTTEQQLATEGKQKVIDRLLALNQDPTTQFVTFANNKDGKTAFAFLNSPAEINQQDGTTGKAFVLVSADPSFPDTYIVNPKDEKPNQSFARILRGLQNRQDISVSIGENGKHVQFSTPSQPTLNDLFLIESISDRKDGPEIFRKAFEESRSNSARWGKINKQTEAELDILKPAINSDNLPAQTVPSPAVASTPLPPAGPQNPTLT